MRVCIIGWYGTETIGDRGILAGILSIFFKVFSNNFSVRLGSLYPYFTERTLSEDVPFFKKVMNEKEIAITIFDSKKTNELEDAIRNSDLIIMGGGPIMHINALYMIEYAFLYARKLNRKTMLFGTGIGPLFKKRHRRATVSIALHSNVVVLRDNASLKSLLRIFEEFGKYPKHISASLDPAVQCLLDFQDNGVQSVSTEPDFVAVNMRSFPKEYVRENKADEINNHLADIINLLTEQFPNQDIRLIPMSYMHVGNDDRDFLNLQKMATTNSRVHVQNIPLTLEQTMESFKAASFCVGMRFHSIVFQTVLNGRNVVLDYTEPDKGKTIGFLRDIEATDYYLDKYINLQWSTSSIDFKKIIDGATANDRFHFNRELALNKMSIYSDRLKSLA